MLLAWFLRWASFGTDTSPMLAKFGGPSEANRKQLSYNRGGCLHIWNLTQGVGELSGLTGLCGGRFDGWIRLECLFGGFWFSFFLIVLLFGLVSVYIPKLSHFVRYWETVRYSSKERRFFCRFWNQKQHLLLLNQHALRALRGLSGGSGTLRSSQKLSGLLRASQGLSEALRASQGFSGLLRASQGFSRASQGSQGSLRTPLFYTFYINELQDALAYMLDTTRCVGIIYRMVTNKNKH